MTIGIGVLASESDTIKPDRLIMMADTKGSFGDDHSMNRLHKLFIDSDNRLYAVGAGLIDRCAELFEVMKDISKIISGTPARYGATVETLIGAADLYKRVRFKLEVLPKFARMPQSLPDMFTDADLTPSLLEAWRKFDFGCQMLVGSFNDNGNGFLLSIEGDGEVSNMTFPGFAAIGSGMGNAMFWLSYRNHSFTFSSKRAAYHAFEAKIMAESSPHVNESLEMVIASKEGSRYLFEHEDQKDPFITELREMFSEMGPRNTNGIK